MVLAQGHKVHVVVRGSGEIKVYDNSIMSTAVKILSSPLRIVAKYEKFSVTTAIFYCL